MTKCNQCNAPLANEDRFCGNCGAVATTVDNLTMPAGASLIAENVGAFREATAAGISVLHQTLDSAAQSDGVQIGVVDVVVILDKTGSMATELEKGRSRHDASVACASASIEQFRSSEPRTKATIIAFDRQPTMLVDRRSVADVDEIARKLRTLKPGGGTNFAPALEMAGKVVDGPTHVLFQTDGLNGTSDSHALKVASDLKDRGAIIHCIGIGSPEDVNERLLKQIASTVDGQPQYRLVSSFAGMTRAFGQFTQATLTRPRIK